MTDWIILVIGGIIVGVIGYFIGRATTKDDFDQSELDRKDLTSRLQKSRAANVVLEDKLEKARAELAEPVIHSDTDALADMIADRDVHQERANVLAEQLKTASDKIQQLRQEMTEYVNPADVASYKMESAKFRAIKNTVRRQGKKFVDVFNDQVVAQLNEDVERLKDRKGEFSRWTNKPTRMNPLKPLKGK